MSLEVGADTPSPFNHTDPAIGGVAVPGTADQTFTGRIPRGIYVATAGDLKVDMADGTTTVPFVGLLAGVAYPFAFKKVYDTGTTIVGIALY